jgi:Xaa-Pro aminopeptidase
MRPAKWIVLAVVLLSAVSLGGMEKEPLAEYASRRARVAEQVKGDLLVLFGAAENDLTKFRQEENFYYLTGFNEPDAVLLIDATRGKPEEALFVKRRNRSQERWTGATMPAGGDGERRTGVQNVETDNELTDALDKVLERSRRVFTLTTDRRSMERLKMLAPVAEPQNAAPLVASLRIRKSVTEIALMEKTIDITLMGHRAAARTIAPGVWEYEVEAALEFEFRKRGAERPAFPSIVGSGPNSTVLHYNASTRQMKAGDLVVVDIGAEYSGYAGDVTRTYPVSGKFTQRQKEIYQIVLDAQKAALEQVRPGATISDVHQAASRHIRSKDHGSNFPHGTSHHLGLYVHDVGDTRRPLEPGMVITVEPGIYIDSEELGVRIEDDVVVTETGYRMLSNFPREIAEIEALMAR